MDSSIGYCDHYLLILNEYLSIFKGLFSFYKIHVMDFAVVDFVNENLETLEAVSFGG